MSIPAGAASRQVTSSNVDLYAVVVRHDETFQGLKYIRMRRENTTGIVVFPNDTSSELFDVSLTIPPGLCHQPGFTCGGERIVVASYSSDKLFMDRAMQNRFLTHGIVSATVGTQQVMGLSPANSISISFGNSEPVRQETTLSCVYWNFSISGEYPV